MIAVDLNKHLKPDADPEAIKQISLAKNLDRDGNTTMFFIIEEAKGNMLGFLQEAVRVL